MLESFVEKKNWKWRKKYKQAKNCWLKSVMRLSIVRKIIRSIKASEKKKIWKKFNKK